MEYTAKVSKEFIDHRNDLALALSKKEWYIQDINIFLRRADHEMPEWHTPEFRTLKKAFGLDAEHDKWKICDFKHMHKPSGNVSISLWAQKQEFDNYVLWDWVNNPKYTKRLPLEEGDEVWWEIIDILSKNSVNNQIINETQFNYHRHVKWQEKE